MRLLITDLLLVSDNLEIPFLHIMLVMSLSLPLASVIRDPSKRCDATVDRAREIDRAVSTFVKYPAHALHLCIVKLSQPNVRDDELPPK